MKTVRQLTKLSHLNLDYTDLSDEGLALIAGLEQLESLSLDSTNVTDAAAEEILSLGHLKELNLYHTLFSPKGFQRLRSALPDCEIVWDEKSSLPTRRRS